jgi:O-antigen/teichoic acid export membrane protein
MMTPDFRVSADRFGQAVAKLRASSFIKNLLVVMSGTALAQVLGYTLSPIISRLYSPSDFGIFSSFYAVLGVITAGITLDYSLAIILPKQKDDAINLFWLSCLSAAIIGIICLIVSFVTPRLIQNLIKTPHPWMLALLVMGILIGGLNQTCQAWSIRAKAFKHTSASQVIRSLSANGTQLGLGYLKGGASALIVSSILGDMLASLNLARVVYRDFRGQRIKGPWSRIWQLAKEYRDFPIYSASMNVVNALSLGLPVILLTRFYGIAMAGSYAFAAKIIQAPMELVLRALRQVLYQKASETHNEGGRLLTLYLKFTGGLFALAIIPSLVLFIWAPPLFTWIFGAQWHTAGVFARIIMVWFIFMFCNLPATICARIARMQRRMAIFDIVLLGARTVVLILGGMYLSATSTIMLFALVGAIVNVSFIVVIGFALKKRESEATWKEILKDIKEGMQ